MAGTDKDHPSPFAPLMAELARMRRSNLKTAIDDVDQIINLLTSAREQVAGGLSSYHVSNLNTKLTYPQKPMHTRSAWR